jgi:two-component system cell cycle response regulator
LPASKHPATSQPLTPHKHRAERRVLLVGSDTFAQRLERSVAAVDSRAIVTTASSYLSAMGAVAFAPVDAIIGPIMGLAGLVEPTVHALRQLAPQAQLVVVADQDDHADVALALDAGFDHCLLRPIDPLHLAEAIGVDRAGASAAGAGQQTSPAQQNDGVIDPLLHPLGQANRHVSDVSDDELGDIDLVDAILEGRGAMRDRAFRLLKAKCQLPGLDWSQSQQDLPAQRAYSAVMFGDRNYGKLHAPPPATTEQIGPWSAWLGHWLAMEEQVANLKHLAMRDELTGAWNRRYFNRFLKRILDKATHSRSQVTLLVFDIDDFKLYNDRYGHGAGDEILRETARLMQAAVREHDVVARIGGDEFAVIFWDAEGPRRPNSSHPHDVTNAARRFQRAICTHSYPKLLDEAPGTLTISGGLASFPWDGRLPEQLLQRADDMAIQSKKKGKNAITFGPGAMRVCELEL